MTRGFYLLSRIFRHENKYETHKNIPNYVHDWYLLFIRMNVRNHLTSLFYDLHGLTHG